MIHSILTSIQYFDILKGHFYDDDNASDMPPTEAK